MTSRRPAAGGSATIANVTYLTPSTATLVLGPRTAISGSDNVVITVTGITNGPAGNPMMPFVTMTTTNSGLVQTTYPIVGPDYVHGYWMAGTDGSVHAFGQAVSYGDMSGKRRNRESRV